MDSFVYLASQSPRRAQLLEQLGVQFALLLPDVNGTTGHGAGDEVDPEALEMALPNEAPSAYVVRVTALKLDAAVARLKKRGLPPAPVLCADTTVAQGRRIFGKPEHAAHAAQMLHALAGGSHRVLTAVAVQNGSQRLQVLSRSTVRFAPMTDAQIHAYAASGEPLGKAGAYAVQGKAAAYIEHLAGSYSGIMGLPMHETAQILRTLGMKI